jgi:hypothetical protein
MPFTFNLSQLQMNPVASIVVSSIQPDPNSTAYVRLVQFYDQDVTDNPNCRPVLEIACYGGDQTVADLTPLEIQIPGGIRFLEIVSAINGLAARQDGYDATSDNLISLGLQRINDTLGPFLTSLQDASQLGFLVCEATGLVVALQVGIDVQFIVNSAGKSVFTPTPWLLAMDENDFTNWAILSLTAYSPTTGVLACGVVYTTHRPDAGDLVREKPSAADRHAAESSIARL